MFTRANVKAGIFTLPQFALIGDNTLGTLANDRINQGIRNAIQRYYEQQWLAISFFQSDTAANGITLPAGTPWGANGKLYTISLTTTPALPSDFRLPQSLWIIEPTSALITPTGSAFDKGADPTTGIPNTSSSLLTTDAVFHQLVNGGAGISLRIYAGSVAAGTTPHVGLIYTRTITLPTADGDLVDIPDEHYLSVFWPILISELQALDFPI